MNTEPTVNEATPADSRSAVNDAAVVGFADHQAKLAAVERSTPDLRTTAVDEHTIGLANSTRHQGLADALRLDFPLPTLARPIPGSGDHRPSRRSHGLQWRNGHTGGAARH